MDADVAYIVYAPLVWHLFRVSCPKIASLQSFIVDPVGSSEGLEIISTWKMVRFLGLKSAVAAQYYKHAKTNELSKFDAIHTMLGLTKLSHPNVFHIPNFVDRDMFRPISNKKDRFTVLFAGRGDWHKGISTFIEIAQLLPSDHYDFETVGAAAKTRQVRYLGFLSDEDLVRAYSEAHCFVNPSRADVFGCSTLESLACGTPVITTPLPSHQRLRLPVIYAQTATQMAHQLSVLRELWMQRRDDYTKLSHSVRIATASYDLDTIGPIYEKMLESVREGLNDEPTKLQMETIEQSQASPCLQSD